jgi:hypothetical protein
MHAASELGVNGRDTGDDGAMNRNRRSTANAKREASQNKKWT